MTHKFTFESMVQEIDVAGKKYRVDFSDEKVAEYIAVAEEMKERAEQFSEIAQTADAAIEVLAEQKEMTAKVIETFLGEGTFDELYEKAGRSVVNLMGLVDYLNEMMAEHTNKKLERQNAKRNKYLGKK